MNRNDVRSMIIAAKLMKGLRWEDVAKKIRLPKEWVAAERRGAAEGRALHDLLMAREATRRRCNASKPMPWPSVSPCGSLFAPAVPAWAAGHPPGRPSADRS